MRSGPCDTPEDCRPVWESMVHIGRIHGTLEGQLPDVAHDGMLMVGSDPAEKLVVICSWDACGVLVSVSIVHALEKGWCSALARVRRSRGTRASPLAPRLLWAGWDADDE